MPDTITFSILAKGLCKTGRITEAIDLLDYMKDQKIKVDVVLINTILDGCFKYKSNQQNLIFRTFK